jgi:hypothetical protein
VLENEFHYVLESKQQVDYAAIKKELDDITQREFGVKSQKMYVMKHTYKNSLFDNLTRDDRGACGIKLPVVLRKIPEQDQIEMTI